MKVIFKNSLPLVGLSAFAVLESFKFDEPGVPETTSSQQINKYSRLNKIQKLSNLLLKCNIETP